MRKYSRGRVFKKGRTWYYEVSVGAKVVFRDNTGSWTRILKEANFDVAVANRVLGSGHEFAKSFDQLVQEAGHRG